MPSRRSQQEDERQRVLAEVEREFWSHVVHELKTPLALLHGYAMTLLQRDLPEDQRRWFLEVMAAQSLRASEGIDRLGEVRRLERTSPEEVADVRASLREAVRRVGEAAPDVPVRLLGDRDRLMVRGSGRWLVRAFEEVLAAAVAAGNGGVDIRLRRGAAISVSVTTAGQIRQSGLGLYLARRVAERFGGSVSLRAGRITVRLLPAGR